MAVVKTVNIHKTYSTGAVNFQALDGINLEVHHGEFLALAGPSGSGKTTLLNILGCLDTPDRGEVLMDAKPISVLNANQLADIRRTRLGFVFQSYNLIPVLTAFENVEYPLILNKIPLEERKRRVSAVLKEVGLEEKMNNFPHQLSGGQQQRVSIARALVGQPMLVLADEPTANLDSHTGQEIIGLMRRLNREKGVTFIFATHDARIIDHASRIVRLEDGRIIADSSGEMSIHAGIG